MGVRRSRWSWLLLAIGVSLACAVHTSWPALVDPLVVHDDVRQHVFWVPRLHDPSLFPNDPIADYYQSQAPPGYQAVYWLATLPMDAVLASKLLPLGLTVILAGAAFALGRALWDRDDAAALGAILLAWSAWQYDDLASATPRAFAMPLLVAQLAALATGRFWLALGLLVLTALLYPLGCALMAVTTGLWLVWEAVSSLSLWERAGVWARNRVGVREWKLTLRKLLWLGAATGLALAIVVAGQRQANRFGPLVTAAQARAMSEFQPGGRSSYFIPDPYKFWIESTRSGLALVPKDALLGGLPALTIPFVLAMGLGIWWVAGRLGWLPAPTIPRRGGLLVALLVASLALFFAAHVLLFTLYLPARHVQFSLPIVWALAGGLGWVLLGERLQPPPRWGGSLFTLLGVVLLVLHAPPIGVFYVVGRHPAIYDYLRTTPVDTRVAALPADSSILPLFGQRAVVTSFEHALPYHLGYYEPFRDRTRALMAAYYAPTLAPLVRLIDEQQVGLVIANAALLERRARDNPDRPPALAGLLDRCGILRERELVVIPADCVRAAASATP